MRCSLRRRAQVNYALFFATRKHSAVTADDVEHLSPRARERQHLVNVGVKSERSPASLSGSIASAADTDRLSAAHADRRADR